jgi:predicted protein tyrosine phosphatase
MDKLKICGRHELDQFESAGFSHMISIGDSDDYFDDLRLPGITDKTHLILKFSDVHDISHPDAPTTENLSPLFSWLEDKPEIPSLLVHCAAGIGRSPAVALLSLCFLYPKDTAQSHMDTVASAAESYHIMPNVLVVAVGESILDRENDISSVVNEWRDSMGDPFANEA